MTFSRAPGLASLLFRIVRSRDARAAAVEAAALRLTYGSRSGEIPLGAIDSAEVRQGWRWGRVRVRHVSGEAAVSGLSRADAEALAAALEAARVDWWRREFAARSEALGSVHARLAQLEDPPQYVTRALCGALEREAREVAGRFSGRWPDTLSHAPEPRMLTAVRGFLNSPEALRARANETYAVSELNRSRAFFDRVEARPLTEEQRRAVVVDEERNLVVAAAGSGKTSVIVAKAGWLVLRGRRSPSELLLLAFARDARNELDERIRRRLRGVAAGGAAVRTFHSLGMAIIGEAEGRRPELARAAEGRRRAARAAEGDPRRPARRPGSVGCPAEVVPGPVRALPEPAGVPQLGGVLGLPPRPRRALAQGGEGQEHGGMRDRQLPLPQRRPLRVRSSLRTRHRDAGEAPVPARLPPPGGGGLHRAFRGRRRRPDRAVRR